MRNPSRFFYSIIIAVFVVLDQLSKFIALKYFADSTIINPGGAFGFNFKFINAGLGPIIITLIAIGLGYSFWERPKLRFAIVFFVAGALGNLIDRIFRPGVIDFIDLKYWPSFNLADILIAAGLVWFAYLLTFGKTKQEN